MKKNAVKSSYPAPKRASRYYVTYAHEARLFPAASAPLSLVSLGGAKASRRFRPSAKNRGRMALHEWQTGEGKSGLRTAKSYRYVALSQELGRRCKFSLVDCGSQDRDGKVRELARSLVELQPTYGAMFLEVIRHARLSDAQILRQAFL